MGSDGIELYKKIDNAYDSLFDRLDFWTRKTDHRKAIEAEYKEVCGDPAPKYGVEQVPIFSFEGTVINVADSKNFLKSLEAFDRYCAAENAEGVSICGYEPGPYTLASTYSRFLDDGRKCPIGTPKARPDVAGAIRLDEAKASHGLNEARRLLGLKYGDSVEPWATDSGLDKYNLINVSIVDRSRLPAKHKINFQELIEGMPKEVKTLFNGQAMSNASSPAKIRWLTKFLAGHLKRAYASGNRSLARRIDNDVELISRLAYMVKDIDTTNDRVKGIDTAKAVVKWALSQYVLALHFGLLIDPQAIIRRTVHHIKEWNPEQLIDQFRNGPKPEKIKVKKVVDPYLKTA